MHDKETSFEKKKGCTAFLNTYFRSLVYYNDCIYFQSVEDKTDKDGVTYELNEICKISTDGTNREVLYSTRDYTIWDFKIHRGYIYFDGSKKITKERQKAVIWHFTRFLPMVKETQMSYCRTINTIYLMV